MDEIKQYTQIRFPTLFETIEQAKAETKRLDIRDAEFGIGDLPTVLQGTLPKFIVDGWRRRRVKLGISWTIEEQDGRICYVMHPCVVLRTVLSRQGGIHWFNWSMQIGKKMTELLHYQVMGLIE